MRFTVSHGRRARRIKGIRQYSRQLERLEDRHLLACAALPFNTTVRGKSVDFDQCYSQSFTDDGNTWAINVYYTEADIAANTSQCTGDDAADSNGDGVPDRCEHKLPNIDDSDGNNIEAVAMANEVQATLQFYVDRSLDFVPAGEDEVNVFIAEDPRGGGIVGTNGLYADDELVANADDLWKRLLAVHEMQHMVQKEYDSGVDWTLYGEGVARATEDRFDTTLDADTTTSHLFIPQFNGLMTNSALRTADLLTLSYDNMGWWTWFMDQYRNGNGTNPPATDANDLGWEALRKVYLQIETDPGNEFAMIKQAITSLGGDFRDDFIDYTLALWAHQYSPSDPRLTYLDTELNNSTSAFSGHRLHTTGPAFATDTVSMNKRSSEYWEFTPASQCEYTAFTFDGNGKDYGFSIMTVDGGTLQDRWTSDSTEWARTVRTTDLDRIVGVVTAIDDSGSVDVGHGCVQPTVNIITPTTSNHKMVGRANNPRTFIVRLDVNGKDGSAVSGLTADAFDVSLRKTFGGAANPQIPATIVNTAYVQEDYWLLVQAPDDVAGAETGEFYDLTVSLGSQTDTELSSILYVEQTQDVSIVLDHSGSMGGGTGKIEAAQNAAVMLVDELADDDQGAYVAFDTNANLRESLDTVGSGSQRIDLLLDIANEVPAAATSIGDGMALAASDMAANKIDTHMCSYVLLSDGMENEPQYWADVVDDVVDTGCAIHTIALGPSANQELMQQIAGSSPAGGSYYYATNTGSVPVNSVIGWQNNLSRLYDAISTDIAGRQRIVTAIRESALGGAMSGVVEFDDLARGTTVVVGQTIKSNGVEITGKPYFPVVGQSTSGGRAIITNQLGPGNLLDIAPNNINLDFDFGGRVDGLNLLFNDSGGNANLRINGDLRVVDDLISLNGAFVGGVEVLVTPFEKAFELTLRGEIDQFSIGGQEFALDQVTYKGDGRIAIPVDDSSDELVVSIGWQTDTGGKHQTQLYDPNNNPVPLSRLKKSTRGTNDVWRVPSPMPGIYRLGVENLPQEFFVTGSVISHYELETFVGTTFEERQQGTEVPIVASFVGNGKPLLGGDIQSTITAPDGHRQTIRLYDDGNHGDSEPNDGIYANTYLATSLAGVTAPPPTQVVEGQEPQGIGSYIVNTVAKQGDIRREAEDSFVIRPARDSDLDGLPDDYEVEHGLDPKNREDGSLDPDMDGLTTLCEFQVGTDPFNSDTDGGGESDGSEVPRGQKFCRTGTQNPNDPADDRVLPLSSIIATPEATNNGAPVIQVVVSAEEKPAHVELVRQAIDARGQQVEAWKPIAELTKELTFNDRDVKDGVFYQYKAMPTFDVAARKTTIDFESFRKGTQFKVGETTELRGILIGLTPFYARTALPVRDGVASIGDVLALGSGQDLLLNNINVQFEFETPLSALSLLYNETEGVSNLIINGQRRIVSNLMLLNGETIGGVQVSITLLRNGYKLDLHGELSSLEIGGRQLVIDDVIACIGEDAVVAGRNLLTPFVQAQADPYSPEGTVQINDGEATTTRRDVRLSITASDNERDSHIWDGQFVQGTPNSKLLMRVSNKPDFAGAEWVPFAALLDWSIDAEVGEIGSVYVQFQDAAGNVSHGLAKSSIRLVAPAPPGDTNLDGKIDGTDIDTLCLATHGQSIPGNGDLDGNGQVDFDDVVYLVTKILGTTFGDANLDKVFSPSDLIQVFAAGEYEDNIPGNSTWATGDWDCDGEFGTSDLIIAFQYGGYNPLAARPLSVVAATDAAASVERRDVLARLSDVRRKDLDASDEYFAELGARKY
ncbi:MAG: VWA domain-containing protein [Planctomycetales bacterium]|nr:VWA domain-containing protein [Planctomycetales bacterium]MCA9166956.1 VWA domain-containing protein [Planctomycetales bacterium]